MEQQATKVQRHPPCTGWVFAPGQRRHRFPQAVFRTRGPAALRLGHGLGRSRPHAYEIRTSPQPVRLVCFGSDIRPAARLSRCGCRKCPQPFTPVRSAKCAGALAGDTRAPGFRAALRDKQKNVWPRTLQPNGQDQASDADRARRDAPPTPSAPSAAVALERRAGNQQDVSRFEDLGKVCPERCVGSINIDEQVHRNRNEAAQACLPGDRIERALVRRSHRQRQSKTPRLAEAGSFEHVRGLPDEGFDRIGPAVPANTAEGAWRIAFDALRRIRARRPGGATARPNAKRLEPLSVLQDTVVNERCSRGIADAAQDSAALTPLELPRDVARRRPPEQDRLPGGKIDGATVERDESIGNQHWPPAWVGDDPDDSKVAGRVCKRMAEAGTAANRAISGQIP
jgi:hypothetical protein